MNHNIQFLKVLSIILVVIGHSDLLPINIWIPVTWGLFIFSFSSGYFTYRKYNNNYNIKYFWVNKFKRLGIKLLTINLFLFVLLIIQKKHGIFSIDTIINVIGMNGFFDWFRLQNESPFGAGGWFLTLLLIFYFCYPFLEFLNRKQAISSFSVCIITSILYLLHLNIIYGHALWITASGFSIGIYFSRINIKINIKTSLYLLIIAVLAAYIFTGHRYIFASILFMSISLFLLLYSLPSIPFIKLPLFFSGCILEIYLIHPYLYLHFFGNRIYDFILSLVVILVLSKMLEYISTFLTFLFQKYFGSNPGSHLICHTNTQN